MTDDDFNFDGQGLSLALAVPPPVTRHSDRGKSEIGSLFNSNASFHCMPAETLWWVDRLEVTVTSSESESRVGVGA